MTMNCDVYTAHHVVICASYRDWMGTVDEWKNAYFMLLSYKNSWTGCISLDLEGGRGTKDYPYVVLRADKARSKGFIDFMTNLGYKVDVTEQTVGMISPDWDNEDYDDYMIG